MVTGATTLIDTTSNCTLLQMCGISSGSDLWRLHRSKSNFLHSLSQFCPRSGPTSHGPLSVTFFCLFLVPLWLVSPKDKFLDHLSILHHYQHLSRLLIRLPMIGCWDRRWSEHRIINKAYHCRYLRGHQRTPYFRS
jgi:hypothetical protein